MTVGDGYNSATGEKGAKCVAYGYDDEKELTPTIPKPGERVQLIFERISDIAKLKELATMNVAASFGWGVFEGDVEFQSIVQHDFNSYTSYLCLGMRVENAARTLKVKRLSSPGKGFVKEGFNTFVQRAGDQYVYGYRSGGEFLALVEFSTQSESEFTSTQQQIDASVDAFIDSGSASFSLKNELQKLRQHSHFKLKMVRSGGLGAMDIDSLIAAFDTFPDRVDPEKGHPWPFEVLTDSYNTVEDFPSHFGNFDQVRMAGKILKTISEWLDTAYERQSDIAYVLSHPDEFDDIKEPELKTEQTKNEQIINDLVARAGQCKSDLAKCKLPSETPKFSSLKPLWKGKTSNVCTIWRKTDQAGNLLSESFDANDGGVQDYFPANHGRPYKGDSAHPVAIGYLTGKHTVSVPEAMIYRVDWKAHNDAARWSTDPGDHEPAAMYQARYDLIDGGRSFRWYRFRQNENASETYTAFYTVPEKSTGDVCNSAAASPPARVCNWYPQPEQCQ